MEHLSNDHKDCLNQHKNSHKLCDETGQWKLAQQHDENFPMGGGGDIVEQTLASEEINISKRAGL